jgi:hypothetical protein
MADCLHVVMALGEVVALLAFQVVVPSGIHDRANCAGAPLAISQINKMQI